MTCRDLALYILENQKEDDPVVSEDGTLVGFASVGEAAALLEVGIPTIYALIHEEKLDCIVIGGIPFVPMKSLKERKDKKI